MTPLSDATAQNNHVLHINETERDVANRLSEPDAVDMAS